MPELLIEIYTEEIPALMQKNAEAGYTEIFKKKFEESDIKYSSIEAHVGPRRIALYVNNIESLIPTTQKIVRGPKVDAPDAAIAGFCKANNTDAKCLTISTVGDQEYYVYESATKVQKVEEILPEIIALSILEYTWPKSMCWGSYEIKFVRPIRNILCIFDDKILPLKCGHLESNNKTFGHRFMRYHAIEVRNFEEYKKALVDNMVILSREERINIITTSLQRIAKEYDISIKDDQRLLEEASGLVEYPNVMVGKIPEKFLHVPSEMLITSMKTHQRYFATYDSTGKFAPYFIFVANIVPESSDSDIIKGNEKVLSARLSDAEYFYNQDKKITLESRVQKLSNIIFHRNLGTLRDKVTRIEKLVQFLAPHDQDLAKAAYLCKTDLVTEAVGEFPELQGIMGGYYAINDGLSTKIANAIRDHYRPLGSDDQLPQGAAAILALADKVDSLVALYAAGERSSGSKDPYGLRRYALGIIRIILSERIRINTVELIQYAASLTGTHNTSDANDVTKFIEDRLKHYMLKTYSHEVVETITSITETPDIVTLETKLKTMSDFLQTQDGEDFLVCYRRANNIIDSSNLEHSATTESLLILPEEQALYNALRKTSSITDQMIKNEDFTNALTALAKLLHPLKQFFDNVTVIDNDQNLAKNRINLLRAVTNEFHKLGKMHHLR